jgi:putative transposase
MIMPSDADDLGFGEPGLSHGAVSLEALLTGSPKSRPAGPHFRGPKRPPTREVPMPKKRHSPEQIAAALRQAEAGTPIAEITRKLGVHENTFYLWKKRYGQLGTPEIRELRQLRDENSKLKRLVADLTLDKTMLQDVLGKKW